MIRTGEKYLNMATKRLFTFLLFGNKGHALRKYVAWLPFPIIIPNVTSVKQLRLLISKGIVDIEAEDKIGRYTLPLNADGM